MARSPPRNSFAAWGLAFPYSSSFSFTTRAMASQMVSPRFSLSSGASAASATSAGSSSVRFKSSALKSPSTITRITPPGIFTSCLICAIVPIWNRPAMSGSSSSICRCVTRNTFCSPTMAFSTALTDLSLLISKCWIMPGSTVSPRSAMAGNVITLFSMLSPLSILPAGIPGNACAFTCCKRGCCNLRSCPSPLRRFRPCCPSWNGQETPSSEQPHPGTRFRESLFLPPRPS